MLKIAVVYNPFAGMPTKYQEALRIIERRSAQQYEVIYIEIKHNVDFSYFVQNSIKENISLIIVAGGDGTLNTVLKQLLATNIPIGIIPTGTYNHFAIDAGIPIDISSATNLIFDAHTIKKVDVGMCNEYMFLNNSTLGIYPRVVELRKKYQKFLLFKRLSFIAASLKALITHPPLHLKIQSKNTVISKKSRFLFIGNNEYSLGGFKTGTRTSLTEGILSLWIVHSTSRFAIIMLSIHSYLNTYKSREDFDVYTTPHIWVDTKLKYIPVSFDGEVERVQTPLYYRSIPACLQIIVPKLQ